MFPAVWRLYYLVSRTTVPSSPADTRSATPGGIWRCSYRAECRSQSQPPLSATIDRTIDWLLDWLISFWWDGHLCVKLFFITNVRIYCKDDENEMHIMYTTIWIKSYWIYIINILCSSSERIGLFSRVNAQTHGPSCQQQKNSLGDPI